MTRDSLVKSNCRSPKTLLVLMCIGGRFVYRNLMLSDIANLCVVLLFIFVAGLVTSFQTWRKNMSYTHEYATAEARSD